MQKVLVSALRVQSRFIGGKPCKCQCQGDRCYSSHSGDNVMMPEYIPHALEKSIGNCDRRFLLPRPGSSACLGNVKSPQTKLNKQPPMRAPSALPHNNAPVWLAASKHRFRFVRGCTAGIALDACKAHFATVRRYDSHHDDSWLEGNSHRVLPFGVASRLKLN